jgi:UDP-2-acetamido-3-amino-2,3-dideoxy-glucuronate N-acetyltransferase
MADLHPTAVIDPGAQIGEGTKIWHFTHVAAGARIGARCVLGQGCYVGAVTIGDGCRIQNNVSLYDAVVLDGDVFLGPSCVFTNVKHPRAHVARKHAYQATRVGPGATIGANATIVCGVSIGAYAMIGAGAVITRDVSAHSLMVGAPAHQLGWACRCGETLPALLESRARCIGCDEAYRLDDQTSLLVRLRAGSVSTPTGASG